MSSFHSVIKQSGQLLTSYMGPILRSTGPGPSLAVSDAQRLSILTLISILTTEDLRGSNTRRHKQVLAAALIIFVPRKAGRTCRKQIDLSPHTPMPFY
jgi:hypothetical protein